MPINTSSVAVNYLKSRLNVTSTFVSLLLFFPPSCTFGFIARKQRISPGVTQENPGGGCVVKVKGFTGLEIFLHVAPEETCAVLELATGTELEKV